MKKIILLSLSIFLYSCGGGSSSLSVFGSPSDVPITTTDPNDPVSLENTYTVKYVAKTNGTISGTAIQTVDKLGNCSTITATPKSGYSFINWSDGSTSASRTDLSVSKNMLLIANFSNTSLSETISGTITYDLVPITTSGLNHSATTQEPVKNVVVELCNDTLSVTYYSTTTNSDGTYSLKAPPSTNVKIIVKAELQSAADSDTKILNNSSSKSLFAYSYSQTTGSGSATQTKDINFTSGWGTTSYTSTRKAAPFAMLDTINKCKNLILSVDSTVIFPMLSVYWEEGSNSGTMYGNSAMYILGNEESDTDEYDAHVIAHEWGHYFEDKFSRSDSIGGSHGSGDILDDSIAFGEGFGNAFAGMSMNNAIYLDSTTSSGTSLIQVYMDLENDSVSSSSTHASGIKYDGYWSEASVQEILYDLYDSNDDGEDNISLGFGPIYQALTNGVKTTPAFTSIFSFSYYLKKYNSGNATKIDSLCLGETITLGSNEFETGTTAYKRYNVLTTNMPLVNRDMDGNNLTTKSTYGTGNKLYNRIFFLLNVKDMTVGESSLITVRPGSSISMYCSEPASAFYSDTSTGGANCSFSITKTSTNEEYKAFCVETSSASEFSVTTGVAADITVNN